MAKKSAKLPLHTKTHKMLAKTLKLLAVAPASAINPNATLARLILLLESYGKKSPVVGSTPVASATLDLDDLGSDINERWDFTAANKYRPGDIDGAWMTQTLSLDIDQRGGKLNGT